MTGVPHEAWDIYDTDTLVRRLLLRVTTIEGELAAGRIGHRRIVAQLREVRLGLSELARRHDQLTML